MAFRIKQINYFSLCDLKADVLDVFQCVRAVRLW